MGVGSYAFYAGVVEEGNALHWGHCSVYLGGDVLDLGLDGQEFLLEAALVVHCRRRVAEFGVLVVSERAVLVVCYPVLEPVCGFFGDEGVDETAGH